MSEDIKVCEQILEQYQYQYENIMEILLDIQKTVRCISRECITYIAEKVNTDVKNIYSMVTYYDFFTEKKQGKYLITVCGGTGCHFDRSDKLVRCIRSELGLTSYKDTTDDGLFTLNESRHCMGACGVGPIVKINDTYYPSVNETEMRKIIGQLRTV